MRGATWETAMSVQILSGTPSPSSHRLRCPSTDASGWLKRILRLGLYTVLAVASGMIVIAQFPAMMDQYTIGD